MSTENIARVFDAWAAEGRDAGLEEGHRDVVEQVLDQIEVAAGQVVLDLGCGNGWATRAIARLAPGVQAIGVDCSPQMIARADELHSFTIRARYDLGAFEALEFGDGHFDRAFSMEAIYYAVDLPRSLAELHRVLRPGAVADVVLNYYAERPATARWPELTGVAMQSLSELEWVEALSTAGFEEVEAQRVVDRRGPGEEAAFEQSEWYASFAEQAAHHEAGSLWLRGTRAS